MYPPPPESTSGGAAPYGQQPEPPYWQQPAPYGQQPEPPYWQQSPYGYEQQPPPPYSYSPVPPPRRNSHKGLKIGLSIGAAVIIAVGGTVAYGVMRVTKGMGDYKLVAPQTFQSLIRQDDNSITKAMKSDGAARGSTSVITSYVPSAGSTDPSLVVIGAYGNLPLASLQISEFWKETVGTDGKNTLTGKTGEQAGPLGGAMQCALLKEDGIYFPTCVWADNSTFAGVMDMAHIHDATPDLAALAAQVQALRTAMETKK